MPNIQIVSFEVDSDISSKNIKFFNIDSSTRFSTCKVGFVIPKNDFVKIQHLNDDILKAEKEQKEKMAEKSKKTVQVTECANQPLYQHQFYMLSYHNRLTCETKCTKYRILHDDITSQVDACTFQLENQDDQQTWQMEQLYQLIYKLSNLDYCTTQVGGSFSGCREPNVLKFAKKQS